MSKKSFRTMYTYSGLYYFCINGEKDGKTMDIHELEDANLYDEDTMFYISDKIDGLFMKYLMNYGITHFEMSYQVEAYTRNGGPLIDYCFKISDIVDIDFNNFDPEFVIEQDNGWTIYVKCYDGSNSREYEIKPQIKARNQKYYELVQTFAFISQLRTIGRTRKFKDELLAKIHVSALKY